MSPYRYSSTHQPNGWRLTGGAVRFRAYAHSLPISLNRLKHRASASERFHCH